ncbi:NAD(P)H-binding protein [Aquabacterium sp.]|uniref:NAD(P)H-binding protein n=1 Tax=Aquabacterium sp. TaxID=1872578 RepID=UPI003D6CEF33
MAGQDAVISCLGQRSSKDAGLLQESARAVIRAMSACGVRRYLVISQGLLYPTANPVLLLLRPTKGIPMTDAAIPAGARYSRITKSSLQSGGIL